MNSFKCSDYLLNSTDPELAYRRRTNDQKITIPWGQRKLLLTTVQFLTRFWDPAITPKPIIVYAGAAPGSNIAVVSELFPEMEFHLYDPMKFKVEGSEKIKLYCQYFMDEDANKWANRNDVFFISDIRTADYRILSEYDNEKNIWQDMEMQSRWVKIIKPQSAHLKFRLPYPNKGMNQKLTYLSGYIFKQPWAPQTSTETRLVPYPTYEEKEYDTVRYESQMFYHNTVIREKARYWHEIINDGELKDDYDSSMEISIICDYLDKRNLDRTVSNILHYSRLFTQRLNEGKPEKSHYTLQKLREDPFLIKRKFKSPDDDDF